MISNTDSQQLAEVSTVCLTLIGIFWYGRIFFIQNSYVSSIQLLLQNLSKQLILFCKYDFFFLNGGIE